MLLTTSIEDYLRNNLSAYLDMLRQMVAINSFTANPEGVNHLGTFTAELFAGLGFQAEYVQSVNPRFGRHLVLTRQGELLLSGELRINLFKLWGNWLGLLLFVDAGDVTPSVTQLQPELHVAVGPDLLYQTPIGAIRLGVGVRLNRKGEWAPGGAAKGLQNPDPGSWGAFHITIGEAF